MPLIRARPGSFRLDGLFTGLESWDQLATPRAADPAAGASQMASMLQSQLDK
jgi:hypothetical protein